MCIRDSLDTSQSLALVGGNLVNRNHLRPWTDCGVMYFYCNETTTSFQLRSCLHSILGELLAMVVAGVARLRGVRQRPELWRAQLRNRSLSHSFVGRFGVSHGFIVSLVVRPFGGIRCELAKWP